MTARQHRDQLIAEYLIKISDRCSEALAAAESKHFDAENAHEYLTRINEMVWRLRWEIGPHAGGEAQLFSLHESEARHD